MNQQLHIHQYINSINLKFSQVMLIYNNNIVLMVMLIKLLFSLY